MEFSKKFNYGADVCKFVFANQMKTTVDAVTQMDKDKPVEMLFSLKSTVLREPEDWWIDFSKFTDEKLIAVGLLKYVQDNENLLTDVIAAVKDHITNNTFGVGTILEFSKFPNIKVIMTDGPRGKFVRIQIGMVYFSFSAERAIMFDWYKLMIDQLKERSI